jgi:hypothetical protein
VSFWPILWAVRPILACVRCRGSGLMGWWKISGPNASKQKNKADIRCQKRHGRAISGQVMPAIFPPTPSISASPVVCVNGKPAGRIGDAISCGGAADGGSPDVTLGDWGGGVTASADGRKSAFPAGWCSEAKRPRSPGPLPCPVLAGGHRPRRATAWRDPGLQPSGVDLFDVAEPRLPTRFLP